MTEMDDFNSKIIEEVRANEGKVGGPFDGAPMVLVHSKGAKSGDARIHPLVFQAVGESFAIFASAAGAPKSPAWYHNLVANPETTIEVGTETIEVAARETEGEERDAIWATQKERMSNFAEYEAKTTRTIPVLLLERR
jgi:deazaflavin-dependent oxidoreductase (nitroreductase family)